MPTTLSFLMTIKGAEYLPFNSSWTVHLSNFTVTSPSATLNKVCAQEVWSKIRPNFTVPMAHGTQRVARCRKLCGSRSLGSELTIWRSTMCTISRLLGRRLLLSINLRKNSFRLQVNNTISMREKRVKAASFSINLSEDWRKRMIERRFLIKMYQWCCAMLWPRTVSLITATDLVSSTNLSWLRKSCSPFTSKLRTQRRQDMSKHREQVSHSSRLFFFSSPCRSMELTSLSPGISWSPLRHVLPSAMQSLDTSSGSRLASPGTLTAGGTISTRKKWLNVWINWRSIERISKASRPPRSRFSTD